MQEVSILKKRTTPAICVVLKPMPTLYWKFTLNQNTRKRNDFSVLIVKTHSTTKWNIKSIWVDCIQERKFLIAKNVQMLLLHPMNIYELTLRKFTKVSDSFVICAEKNFLPQLWNPSIWSKFMEWKWVKWKKNKDMNFLINHLSPRHLIPGI